MSVKSGTKAVPEPMLSRGRSMNDVRELVGQRARCYAGRVDADERALLSLYGDGELTESDVRRYANATRWEFLEMVGRQRDVLPSHDDFYAALDAPDRR
jgi:hypothetical protein